MSKPTLEIALLALTSEPSGLDFSEKKVIWPKTNSGEAPTWGDLENKLTELQADYDAKKYQRDRATSYPSIQEQLDMQYWDAVNGTKKWQEAVAKVKADNPKPE